MFSPTLVSVVYIKLAKIQMESCVSAFHSYLLLHDDDDDVDDDDDLLLGRTFKMYKVFQQHFISEKATTT